MARIREYDTILERRPAFLPPFPAFCLLLALTLGAAARRLEAAQGPARLCIEYLPTVIYDDEAVTVCTRAEAGGEGQTSVSVALSLLDEDGDTVAEDEAESTVAPGEPWRHHAALPPRDGSPAMLVLRLAEGGRTTASLEVRVLDGRAPLPPLEVKGMRLVDAKGRRAIVRIDHRVYRRKEHWPFVRWIGRKLYGEGWDFERVFVLASDLGASEGGYLDVLTVPDGVALDVRRVPSETQGVALPVLRGVCALLAKRPDPAPDLAVIALGHTDADYGTDVIEFGRALELVVQQLELAGCSQFALVAPIGPPHHRVRLGKYADAARRVAHVYHGRLLHPARALGDAHWAAGPEGARVALRWPNAQGHKALAGAIGEAIAELRR